MSSPTFSPYQSPGYTTPEQTSPTPTVTHSGATAPYTGTPVTAPDDSALAFIRDYIHQFFGGALDAFAEKAWGEYNSGTPIEQILFELRATPEYAARFPGMKELTAAGRPISEASYLDLERTYKQVAAQFDLPPTLLDTDYLGKIIGGEKSPAEFQSQLQEWQTYERATRDPVLEAEINRQFAALGLVPSNGDYLAALLRPDVAPAHIEQRLLAGQIGAEALRAGFGQLDVGQGLGLADQGVTVDQARQGFTTLADNRQLLTALPGEAGGIDFTTGQQIGAAFGTDNAARRRIEEQRAARLAQFGGGGGVSGGRTGLGGVGASA